MGRGVALRGEYLIAIPLYANRARLDEGDELFVGVTHLLH